jgi:hypothetical protein
VNRNDASCPLVEMVRFFDRQRSMNARDWDEKYEDGARMRLSSFLGRPGQACLHDMGTRAYET